jgi:quercetin dioxygenase-like cupin family protein
MTQNEVDVQHWPAPGPPTPAAVESRMQAEGLGFYRWSNGPGDVYGAHDHPYDKIIHVVSGAITFGLPDLGKRLPLNAGDRLYLPAGTVHDAVVGDRGVVCLEAHKGAA